MENSRVGRGRRLVGAALALSLIALGAVPALASAQAISAEMSGAAVKNSQGGDVDGLAALHITSIEASQGKLCFKASWTRLGAVTGLFLYEGAQGATGKQVAKLLGPTRSSSANGCTTGISATTLGKIEANPVAYFAAITTSEYPSGAVRGQLSGGLVAAPGRRSRSPRTRCRSAVPQSPR